MLVIVDADPIVYRAGFAGESHTRRVVWSPPDSDDIFEVYFEPKDGKTAGKMKKEWLENFEEPPVILEEEIIVVPEDLEYVLATVKAMLRETRNAVAEHFDLSQDDVILRVLLTGPGNFRNEIATVKPYKGNRKDAHKPYWYQQIRNYLTDWWDAQVVEGREADDECAILQYKINHEGVIATIDKDLDQVPGWHYDYVRKTFYKTEEDEGHLLFYKQVLSGDSTDNIPGCYKIGSTRASRIVDEMYLEHGMDHKKIWEKILEVYAASLDQYGEDCPYYDKAHEEGIERVAIEMARLVKMQEYEGQLWNPPGMPDDMLEMEFE